MCKEKLMKTMNTLMLLILIFFANVTFAIGLSEGYSPPLDNSDYSRVEKEIIAKFPAWKPLLKDMPRRQQKEYIELWYYRGLSDMAVSFKRYIDYRIAARCDMTDKSLSHVQKSASELIFTYTLYLLNNGYSFDKGLFPEEYKHVREVFDAFLQPGFYYEDNLNLKKCDVKDIPLLKFAENEVDLDIYFKILRINKGQLFKSKKYELYSIEYYKKLLNMNGVSATYYMEALSKSSDSIEDYAKRERMKY